MKSNETTLIKKEITDMATENQSSTETKRIVIQREE